MEIVGLNERKLNTEFVGAVISKIEFDPLGNDVTLNFTNGKALKVEIITDHGYIFCTKL